MVQGTPSEGNRDGALMSKMGADGTVFQPTEVDGGRARVFACRHGRKPAVAQLPALSSIALAPSALSLAPVARGGLEMVLLHRSMIAACLLPVVLLAADSDAGYRLQPKGCEFSVEFPGRPQVYDVVIPPLGRVPNAEYRSGKGPGDGFILVAECFAVLDGSPIDTFNIY